MKRPHPFRSEIRSLFHRLARAGFRIVAVDNGGGNVPFENEKQALDEADACDEAHVYFVGPNGKQRWAFLVLGNSHGELVSDYGVPRNPVEGETDEFEAAIHAHSEAWEGIVVRYEGEEAASPEDLRNEANDLAELLLRLKAINDEDIDLGVGSTAFSLLIEDVNKALADRKQDQ